MKITKTTLTLLISSFIILLNQSCSIQKRVHMGGYHIQWNKNNKQNLTKNFSEQNSDEASLEQNVQDTFKLQSDKSKLTNDKPIYFSLLSEKQIKVSSNDTICDNIILKNGEEISAKVIEVADKSIKYKKCNNLTGPSYTILKDEVSIIKYSNGTKDNFNNETGQKEININRSTEYKFASASFWALISGLLIALFFSIEFGLVLAFLALIFGIIALYTNMKSEKFKNKGWITFLIILDLILSTGLIIGLLSII